MLNRRPDTPQSRSGVRSAQTPSTGVQSTPLSKQQQSTMYPTLDATPQKSFPQPNFDSPARSSPATSTPSKSNVTPLKKPSVASPKTPLSAPLPEPKTQLQMPVVSEKIAGETQFEASNVKLHIYDGTLGVFVFRENVNILINDTDEDKISCILYIHFITQSSFVTHTSQVITSHMSIVILYGVYYTLNSLRQALLGQC